MAKNLFLDRNPFKRYNYHTKSPKDLSGPASSSSEHPSSFSASELFRPQELSKHLRPIVSQHPIPKGNSTYARAKRAEYIDKDLALAEEFLKRAIIEGDRAESAAKDLAGLLHRQGRTDEACMMLQEHRACFKERFKYENLLNNLMRQVSQSGNSLNKLLKVSGLRPTDSAEVISAIFADISRISSIQLGFEEAYYGKNHFAVIKFNSHSAARRTLEGFSQWGRYKIEWMRVSGEVTGEVFHSKPDGRRDRRTFMHKLFWRDPEDRILTLPLDKHCTYSSDFSTDSSDEEDCYTPELEILLGTNLVQLVFEKSESLED
jgi:hypothetical protein